MVEYRTMESRTEMRKVGNGSGIKERAKREIGMLREEKLIPLSKKMKRKKDGYKRYAHCYICFSACYQGVADVDYSD